MSGNYKLITQIGIFKCLQCLETVLDLLDLKKVLEITPYRGTYKITLRNPIKSYEHNRKNMDYIYIKNYHEKILPRYAEVHAIHSLTSQGFKLVSRDDFGDRYVITLEKQVLSRILDQVDRYRITVLPKQNVIFIDGGNMPGDTCRQYVNNYVRSVGKIDSFVPYNAYVVRDFIGNDPSSDKTTSGAKKTILV